MPRALHVRLDEDAEVDLNVVKAEGLNDSQAVRAALHEAAMRRRRRTTIREEVARLAADTEDRAEMRAIADDMAELAPEWPD